MFDHFYLFGDILFKSFSELNVISLMCRLGVDGDQHHCWCVSYMRLFGQRGGGQRQTVERRSLRARTAHLQQQPLRVLLKTRQIISELKYTV